MADIPQHLVDSIMVKAGRRCCVCRRFQPTRLQVHHVVLRSNGGTDDEDNLMPICLTCHTDVHSKVPFTRRFTVAELKGHRESLFAAVHEGRWPVDEDDNTSEIDRQVVISILGSQEKDRELSSAAVELLLATVSAKGNWQGRVGIVDRRAGKLISVDDRSFGEGDRREVARYLAGLEELERDGLLAYESEAMRELTHLGYLKADELRASQAQTTTD